jgi:carotenoid cleavage dioxygenase
MRSDLAILDARNIAAGPVVLIRLPTRIRSTFHGMWVPQSALETGQYPVTVMHDREQRAAVHA